MHKVQEKHKTLEEELERLKREIDETYRGVTELTNELVEGVSGKDTSELKKEIESLSEELEETYRAVTELANELYDANAALQKSETQLRHLNEELELRVVQRTTELEQTNQKLKSEIEKHEQTEQKLHTARIAAEEASQAKSMFLANMSHELRTPLNGILGFSNLMLRESLSNRHPLSAEQQEYLGIISRSGEHLLSLINNVLDLSKIEASRVTINPIDFDFYSLLDELHNMFTLKATNKGLKFILEFLPNVPQYIKADSLKLRQVLINLLNNAFKFTKVGKVVLRVSLFEKAKTQLHFEVEDTGFGIAAEELDTLFEAFTQTKSGLNTQEGTGLGLAISNEFVNLMGGKLEVCSEVNKGSVFSFNINVELTEKAAVKDEEASKQIIGLKSGQEIYRVLLVDDNDINRQLLVRLLQPLGFDLKEAKNGQEAIDIWQEWQPHLIWMDIRMPVVDGYAATRIIKAAAKARGEQTKIIALTASALEEERATVMAAGCDDYLKKPFKDRDVFEAMHRHIGVEYLYREVGGIANRSDTEEVLTPEALKVVPVELLSKLEELGVLANIKGVAETIEEVRPYGERVARALTELANSFEYTKIARLARAAIS